MKQVFFPCKIKVNLVQVDHVLMFIKMALLFSHHILFLVKLDVPSSLAHIGQPCNLLGICWPPNLHIYCDDNKICQCRPETPVVVGPHQCKRNKSHGDKCSSDGECIFSDTNSICDSNQCNCKSNFTYDPYIMKCIHGE